MSYTADKKITQSAAMALLKTCRYGNLNMATIMDIANRATTYTIDSARQRIGIHGTGLEAVLPIVSIHNTDYVDTQCTNWDAPRADIVKYVIDYFGYDQKDFDADKIAKSLQDDYY